VLDWVVTNRELTLGLVLWMVWIVGFVFNIRRARAYENRAKKMFPDAPERAVAFGFGDRFLWLSSTYQKLAGNLELRAMHFRYGVESALVGISNLVSVVVGALVLGFLFLQEMVQIVAKTESEKPPTVSEGQQDVIASPSPPTLAAAKEEPSSLTSAIHEWVLANEGLVIWSLLVLPFLTVWGFVFWRGLKYEDRARLRFPDAKEADLMFGRLSRDQPWRRSSFSYRRIKDNPELRKMHVRYMWECFLFLVGAIVCWFQIVTFVIPPELWRGGGR
jgi:hypothetical protein